MKLIALVTLTMIAFAANSVLNRLALSPDQAGAMGPASFLAIRLLSGAVMLMALLWLRTAARPAFTRGSALSGAMLLLYAAGFSFAYITLPTGVGALILFGGVQVVSFAVTFMRGKAIGALSWIGALIAFGGLCYLLWPSDSMPIDPWGAALMLFAAVGWALYTLAGAKNADPLGATSMAFLCAAPLGVLLWLAFPDSASPRGITLAVISGAVTSGLGYALWYKVLPQLSVPVASVAQLTVPVIAALGGALFLGENLTLGFAVATGLVLCGVGLTIMGQSRSK